MADVWKLYEVHAREFDRDRGRSLMERSYLSDMVARLRPGARVLDLSCGAVEPIARFFIEHGFDLTGVDASPAMIAICKERFPDAAWVEADMRGLVLPLRVFVAAHESVSGTDRRIAAAHHPSAAQG